MGQETPQQIATMRTEVSLPAFPISHRCHVCQIYHQDPAVYEELSKRLLFADKREEIVAWLRQQGYDISLRGLARHWSRHLRPYVAQVIENERRIRAEIRALEGEDGGQLASALAHKLVSEAFAALRDLQLATKLKNSDPKEITAVMREITRVAKTLADINRAEAETDLKRKLVELRAIELALKEGKVDEIARQWIIAQLRDDPDRANEILERLELAPIKQLKALPAGGSQQRSKKNATTKRTKTQRGSRRSRRPKRQ